MISESIRQDRESFVPQRETLEGRETVEEAMARGVVVQRIPNGVSAQTPQGFTENWKAWHGNSAQKGTDAYVKGYKGKTRGPYVGR